MPATHPLAPADSVAAALHDGKVHLLLAASGSVATIKLPLIIDALRDHANLAIRVVLTRSAAHFLQGQATEQPDISVLAALPNVEAVYQDEDESPDTWTRSRGILHINLRKWADLLAIAPLSANTLAKIVNGMCDNLLTAVVRAWDTSGRVDGTAAAKRILVFPAMNAAMWLQPITTKQIRVLEEDWGVQPPAEGGDGKESRNGGGESGRADRPTDTPATRPTDMLADRPATPATPSSQPTQGWFEVFRPIEKSLACGDVGVGGMREWKDIVKILEQRLNLAR